MRVHFLGGALALIAVVACSLTTSSPQANESCAPAGPCGTGTMQVCLTQDSKGACQGTRYKLDNGDSFQCSTCGDCTQAQASATSACQGGGGTGTTCTNGATCSTGSPMKVCTTLAADGSCSAIAYTVGSQTFTCAGCTACTATQAQASQACAGGSGSGSGSGSGGSSGSGSGGSSGGGSGGSSGGGSGGSSGGGSGGSSGGGSGGSSGGDASVSTFDGTSGKACATDTDCHAVGGPGVNRCSSSSIFSSGPLYPSSVCIDPTTCDPGTDGGLHFCDGPDDPSSPGVCIATGTPGQGVCLPQCTFATNGSPATGCVGKDSCYVAGFSSDASGGVTGLGYCFGGCAQNTDCPAGSTCQTNLGLCTTTTVAPSAAGTSCNATTPTNACSCFASSTTNLGFCANFCSVGSVSCPAGWTCETELPRTLVSSTDASVAGWTTQNAGMAGLCVPSCVVDGAAVCPTNSTCQPGTAAGPDCEP